MKPVTFALCLALMSAPVLAEETSPTPEPESEGRSMMEEGAMLFFRGLQQQMQPALQGLADLAESYGPALESFAEEMGPSLAELFSKVEDWSVYEAPEILPNGDIIIRRKPEAEEAIPETPPEGQTDL